MPRKSTHSRSSERSEGAREGARSSRAFWSGTISFGLVTIPVELYSATRESRRSLRMLSPSGVPVARRYFNDKGDPLDREQIARGFQLEDDFIVVTDEELEALAPDQSRDIELSRFVDRDAISPLFFERAYVMAPAGQSNAAYRLLAGTLERTGKAGIARFVMRGKQYPVAIFGEKGLLRAQTMRFAEELRTPAAVGLPEAEEVDAKELRAMSSLISKHRLRSKPEKALGDRYEAKLEALVKKKQKSGKDVVHVEPEQEGSDEPVADVIDLVSILKQSLGQGASAGAGPGHGATKKKATKRAPAKKSSARAADGR